MKTSLFLFAVVMLIVQGSLHAAHPLTLRYLEGLFRAKPHLATFMGDHRFDDRLPDVSQEARERQHLALEEFLQRAISMGEDFRSGRWWWEATSKECGLHETKEEVKVK